MKIKNSSNTRPYHVGGVLIAPGATADANVTAADIAGLDDLSDVTPKAAPAEVAEFKEVPTTKAELVAALKEAGVEFDQSASKADLQAIYDASK